MPHPVKLFTEFIFGLQEHGAGAGMTKKKPRKRNATDEKIALTKGQLLNVVDAASGKSGACKKAVLFVKQLRKEVKSGK